MNFNYYHRQSATQSRIREYAVRITIFWALGRDKLRPNCYTIRRKDTVNPNYILNRFMLFYKDKNIEHKNET